MSEHILTINAGSSSLKFALFGASALDCIAIGLLDGLGTDPNFVMKDGAGRKLAEDMLEGDRFVGDHPGALRTVLDAVAKQFPGVSIAAVGHRVVHGGPAYSAPVVVDDEIMRQLREFVTLAPLHQPHNLSGIEAARAAFPGVPQVACFDTGFHNGHPFVHDAFALPRSFYDEGVRRYGFHGLSYEYIAAKLAEMATFRGGGRVVVCHLGSGASMCALEDGKSITSTMGFSALDGLPMGTRPGRLDAGVMLYLMDEKGMDAKAISDMLYKQSGLKGLSGISNDMRDLESSSDPRAKEAIDYFVAHIRREIGAMAAVLGGLDAIVFCAGIGENSRSVRAAVLEGMQWLGIELDHARNEKNAELISSDRSSVRVFVIPTNEELMIARHTARLTQGKQASAA